MVSQNSIPLTERQERRWCIVANGSLMNTPDLTPSWVAREEQTFCQDLFPHIPAINAHIKQQSHTTNTRVKINPLPKPNVLVVIDNEEEPSIENVDKNKNVQNSKNNSTSNNKYNCNDTDLLIEELEKELLSLDNSETSDQKKIQSTNKPEAISNASLVRSSTKNSNGQPSVSDRSFDSVESYSSTRNELQRSLNTSPKQSEISPSSKKSPLSHTAFLSYVFGSNSVKPPTFTVGGKKVRTPNGEASRIRDRLLAASNQTAVNKKNPWSKTEVSSKSNGKASGPILLSDDDITEFTPTPVENKQKKQSPTGKKRKRKEGEDKKPTNQNSPKRKKNKLEDDLDTANAKLFKKQNPTMFSPPSPPGSCSELPSQRLVSLSGESDMRDEEFNCSLDVRMLHTPASCTNDLSALDRINQKTNDSDDELNLLNSSISYSRSNSNIGSSNEEPTPPSSTELSLSEQFMKPTPSSSSKLDLSDEPPASFDPLALASGVTPSPAFVTLSASQLYHENYILKQKLSQLELTAEYWSNKDNVVITARERVWGKMEKRLAPAIAVLNSLDFIKHRFIVQNIWDTETRKLLKECSSILWKTTENIKLDFSEENFPRLNNFENTFTKLNEIVKILKIWENETHKVERIVEFKRMKQSEFFGNAPYHFLQHLHDFFYFQFILSSNQFLKENPFTEIEEEEEGEEGEETKEEEKQTVTTEKEFTKRKERLKQVCKNLVELNSLRSCESIITQIVLSQIKDLIITKCKSSGEPSECGRLSNILFWLENFVFVWLQEILSSLKGEKEEKFSYNELFSSISTRLEFFVHETFANVRINDLFDIIIDYPDSLPALEDLKQCLIKTNQLPSLVRSLRQVFEKRLLHPGANTNDIIGQYINTIKALQVIDGTGISIERVSVPICEYLQKREDTIRTIVTMFTDDTSELYQELSEMDKVSHIDDDLDNDDWVPAPTDALPTTVTGRSQDLFTRLVNIYGSRELFVSEYRNMLAERLLNLIDFNVDKELRVLELLKLRFGEQSLHNCDIMIKDVKDSKRMNKLVHEENKELTQINPLIVSYLFWPSFREDTLVVPPAVKQLMTDYFAGFKALKRDRKIEWVSHLGLVELDLEVEGEVKNFTVSPVLATIIHLFQDQPVWNIHDLANVTGVGDDVLRRRIIYWINQGILQMVDKENYKVREAGDELDNSNIGEEEDEEDEFGLTSSKEEREAMWMLCKNVINASLQNNGPQPLERIHMTLSTFMSDVYNATPNELYAFLEDLVQQDQLEKDDNLYKKKK